ncbi:Asp-tRNA(Asn)/Glu-tRNA(Gln) amidotransferase subunit GatC [Corynebacterium flavescens]|uniref:Asp-tRNA(Asn)/Glu-tRNA(Gln) amidotransferase subunit GatC n=1 Tax=Corynebacterium flavescens TaxID=28028 RepID=UPI0035E3C189
MQRTKDGVRVSEISRDEVAHLAKLSRLALSEEELAQFAKQIDEIVGAVSAVRNVDAEGVEPMSHPHSIQAPMREDKIVRTLNAEQALDQAPAVQDGRFAVSQILGGE